MNQHNAAKVFHAIVGGAAAGAGTTTSLLMALNAASGPTRLVDFAAAHMAWFALSFLVTALVSSTLGLAWHAHASRRGWRSLHAYWAPGAIVGGLIPIAIIAGATGPSVPMALLAIYGGALGGLTGLFAWLIRRPDRDQPNPPTHNP